MNFSSDFWFLRRRLAGANQGKKDKKRRKGTLAGVFALVNRWYCYVYKSSLISSMGISNPLYSRKASAP